MNKHLHLCHLLVISSPMYSLNSLLCLLCNIMSLKSRPKCIRDFSRYFVKNRLFLYCNDAHIYKYITLIRMAISLLTVTFIKKNMQ